MPPKCFFTYTTGLQVCELVCSWSQYCYSASPFHPDCRFLLRRKLMWHHLTCINRVNAHRHTRSIPQPAGPQAAKKSPSLEAAFLLSRSQTPLMMESTINGWRRPWTILTRRADGMPLQSIQMATSMPYKLRMKVTKSATVSMTEPVGFRMVSTLVVPHIVGTFTWLLMLMTTYTWPTQHTLNGMRRSCT